MQYVDDKAEWRRFYEALLELPWLAPRVRVEVMRTLGRSKRAEDANYERGRSLTMMCWMVNQRKALLEKKGERPRGGAHEAAIAEIASEQGMTVAA